MILLNNFLSSETAAELERLVRDGPYRMSVQPFQPEPIPLPAESFGQDVSNAFLEGVETGVLAHRRLVQPARIKAISGPDCIRFLDGMSLGYSPVPALHDVHPVSGKGMRCDAVIHVRLSAPGSYTGGDFQTAGGDRPAQRFALGQGDAVLFDWEDIFSLRVVHQGPLLHMIIRLQYEARPGVLEATSPLAQATHSANPETSEATLEILQRTEKLYRSRNASPAPPSNGETT